MAEPLSDPPSRWRRAFAALPMRLALLAVASVWLLGCVWSFEEQTAFAASRQFALPQLLPLVIDGFAAAMAGVAWAASLDARPAIAARVATLLAVAGSAASNGTWAWIRTGRDMAAVILAVAVPLAANLAFEVLLAELRRQVQRRRGLPAPVAIPYPRLLRLALAPWRTLCEWRALVLDLTVLTHAPRSDRPSRADERPALASQEGTPALEISGVPHEPLTPADETSAHRAVAAAPAEEVRAPKEAASPRDPAVQDEDCRGGSGRPTPSDRPLIGDRRLDPRAVALAEMLSTMPDSSAITGEMAGQLLGVELAPRTGRRLLGQARAVMAASDSSHDPGRTALVGATRGG